MDYPVKEKVVAYITRNNYQEILVFDHDKRWIDAGVQVPAGSIENNESQKNALLREIEEESGLTNLRIIKKVDEYTYFREDLKQYNLRHVYLLTANENISDQWTHTVSGKGIDRSMIFLFYWITIQEAKEVLVGGLEKSLDKISDSLPQLNK